jgi:uncharacterized protein
MSGKSLDRRRGIIKGQHGTTYIFIGVILITLIVIWIVLFGNVYVSLQNHRVRQQPTSTMVKDVTKGLLRSNLHLPSEKMKTSTSDYTKLQDKSSFDSFTPKFPIRSRNLSLEEETLKMCDKALWHTLETTTIVLPDGDTFIHTGDIDDLWLRDSAAQIHPLLIPFGNRPSLVASDPKLARVVSGLIQRTSKYIRHDPYANAFRIDDTYVFSDEQKRLGRHDLISTWNYELDSACYYMRMIYYFYKAIPDHPVLQKPSVKESIDIMLDVWISEQNHEGNAFPVGPLLDCKNCGKPYRYPGLPRLGKGSEVAYTGMTWTGFRPSDDACQYGYLIPANMFAVVVLGYMQEIAENLWNDDSLLRKAKKLASDIDHGIHTHGILDHPTHGKIYAYEVDGLGNFLLMDDANVPSLMSIPYLGYDYDPIIYQNTRRFILSMDNPTYQKGSNAATGEIEGYGSPHMSQRIRKNIWPMALAMQALTSSNLTETLKLVNQLTKSTGGTGWMHESFDVYNPGSFTRSWFCWADSLFAELVMSLTDVCPRSKYRIMKWTDPIEIKGGPLAAG